MPKTNKTHGRGGQDIAGIIRGTDRGNLPIFFRLCL